MLYISFGSTKMIVILEFILRLLLTPVRLGGQAISWAAGKGGSNGDGLPMSPSSSDIQSRVLQAAAKHESVQSDDEEGAEASAEKER